MGGFFLNFVLFGWWWFYFDFLEIIFKGNFFSGVLCWKFIYICGERLVKFDQHSHIHSHNFFCTVGRCKCWTVFFCIWAQTCSLIIVFG